MKFTLSWLREHLDTQAGVADVVDAMTMAGLEVEEVQDPAAKLAAFSVARIVEAVQHPNADRLRVCQVDTKDGRKEIVCGAPNARAGLTTIYAPIGAFVPGSGITLEARPVRGVVSNGMLCSAAELETSAESDGIVELDAGLAIGTPAAEVFGLEAVIDFEVTPNRPDWLGVQGIARDLGAAGLGAFKQTRIEPVPGRFDCPVEVRLENPEACPVFAARVIRGVRNGPSPAWLQAKLISIGLRPINALVDITNLISFDQARPLHVFDAAKVKGAIQVRLAREGETLEALDGKTYRMTPELCVVADDAGPLGIGGVMGGAASGCTEATTDVVVECAWFDPIRTAQAGRITGIQSDAQYRFARGVDPQSVEPGMELATRMILDLCGGEPSTVRLAGQAPAPSGPIAFDRSYVRKLSGLDIGAARIDEILGKLGFTVEAQSVTPPTWRRDVEGKADLVEEVARIQGYDALPAEALPEVPPKPGGALTGRQSRVRTGRRALAALGYQETVTWSFLRREWARLFGGGDESLVVTNPIAAELDCMRPSILPNLIDAAGRNARKGFPDVALFELAPIYRGDRPQDQAMVAAGVVAANPPRRWDGGSEDALFALKSDVFAFLEDLGAPAGSLQIVQSGLSDHWRPGRSAALKLGPKTTIAEFGEIHPRILKALDVDGPIYGFEIDIDAIPEPKRKATKTKPAVSLSPLMPLSRDFAFLVGRDAAAGDLVRAVAGADKALIAEARVFDVYQGPGVPDDAKSVAVEVVLQPRERTLTDAEIEAVSARIVAAAEKAVGAKLRT